MRETARCYSYRVEQDADGMRTAFYLKGRKQYSHRMIVRLRHHGSILRNGQPIRTVDTLEAGDLLEVFLPAGETELAVLDCPVPVRYEDADALVYDKPWGMPCHPSRAHADDTLANVFAGYCRGKGLAEPFRPINRLDMDTSGLVVTALNAHAAQYIRRTLRKEYIAVCEGLIPEDGGRIEGAIRRVEPDGYRRGVFPDGRPSATEFRVLAKSCGRTMVSATPLTGRTHQIRVHFAHIGFPLTGDAVYGNASAEIRRHALHCKTLWFESPADGHAIRVEAPVCEDIMRLMDPVFCEKTCETAPNPV